LDIDLRNSDPEKVREKSNQFGLLPDIFLQKSGMVLFLILLEKGFPREQIIFLTGNADKNNLSKLVDIISSSKDIEQIKNTTEKVLDFLSDEQKTELKQKSTKEDKVNYIKNLALNKVLIPMIFSVMHIRQFVLNLQELSVKVMIRMHRLN